MWTVTVWQVQSFTAVNNDKQQKQNEGWQKKTLKEVKLHSIACKDVKTVK